jgi:3-oxoacyl-[acyl-carrier-protein] synthase-3
MSDVSHELLTEQGFTHEQIDLFIPHQANLRIIDAVRERLGIPEQKMVVNIGRYGNTSSASIPLALDELMRAGRLEPGDRIAFTAFGGGATWGSAVMTWTLAPLAPAGVVSARPGAGYDATRGDA